ncbi:MAG: FHA domain-containing protein [Planctomycetota bacterium]|nr:MAG: FHA domain-containing protein [Planctomycetota bacterium]
MQAKLISLDNGRAIPITNDITIVGRKRGVCDICLDSNSVSKLHCLIVKTDGLLFVRDLGSTNGTKVNGQKITRGALLPGDELAFASARFKVFLGPDEPPAEHEQPTEVMSAVPSVDVAADQFTAEPASEDAVPAEIDSASDVRLLPDDELDD